MDNERELDGSQIEQSLADGSLSQTRSALYGMVDKATQRGYVKFTMAGCDKWLDMPVDAIDKFVPLGTRRCDDHRHPFVKLFLKEPEDGKEKLLYQLLMQSWEVNRRATAVTTHRGSMVQTLRRQPGGFGYDAGCNWYACGTCPDGSIMFCLDETKPNDNDCWPDMCFSDLHLAPRFSRGRYMY